MRCSCERAAPALGRPVVIVDDDEGMRRAIERLLHIVGYDTQAFASGEAVLVTRAGHEAGCIVLDVRLPGVSGFELRARLRAEGAMPPVIFMSAHEELRDRDSARDAEAVAYLVKPFAASELLDAVERAFAG